MDWYNAMLKKTFRCLTPHLEIHKIICKQKVVNKEVFSCPEQLYKSSCQWVVPLVGHLCEKVTFRVHSVLLYTK